MAPPSPARSDSAGSPFADRGFLALLAVGLAVRVALALWLDDRLVPRGDEPNYLARSLALWRRGVLETGDFVRPPLYFVLLAGLRFAGDALGLGFPLAVRLLQCVAGAATAVPVYRTAARLGGRRVALVAAGFLLLDPTLVAYSHLLWPETFFLFAVAVVFDGLHGIERRSAWRVAGLGALTGLALLLKPVLGLFTLLLAGQWLRRLGLRTTLRLVLVFGGAAAVVVAPWVVRNQLRYGPAILLENQLPYNLWIGNSPLHPLRVLDRWKALPDPVTRSRVGMERGLEAIAADPARFARTTLRRAANLWGLEYFVVRHATIGGYGRLQRAEVVAVFWLVELATAVSLLAAAAGLRRAVRDPTLRLLAVYALAFTAIVSTMVATTRFRVPFAFLICVSAGIGVDRLLARRLEWRDLVPVAIAAALLLSTAVRDPFAKVATGDFERLRELRRMDWNFFRY